MSAESIAQSSAGLDDADIQILKNDLEDGSFSWDVQIHTLLETESNLIVIPCVDESAAWVLFDALEAAGGA